MRTLYNGLIGLGCYLQPVILLVMRISWGYAFFLAGYAKFGNIEGVTTFFGEVGVPFPMVNAYFVAGVECVGGLLLMVGLLSRLSALLLFCTMTVAYFTAHFDAVLLLTTNPAQFTEASPFMFWLTSLLVLAFGPGLLSIDALLKRFVFQKKN